MKSLQKMISDLHGEPTWTEKPVLSNLISKLEKVNYTEKKEKEEFANRIFVANSAAENVSHFVALLVPAMQNYSFNASVELEIYRIILSSYELSEDKVNNSANIATQIATFRPWILKRLYEEGFNNLGNIVPTAIFSASSRDAFDYIFKTESKFFKTNFGLTEDAILGSRMQVEGEEQERDILRAAIDAFFGEGERENCFYAAQWAIEEYGEKVLTDDIVRYLLKRVPVSSKQSLFAGLFLQHIDKVNASQDDVQGLIGAVKKEPEVLTLIDQAHINKLKTQRRIDQLDTARGTKVLFGVIAAVFACIAITALFGYFFAAATVLTTGLVAGGSGLLAVASGAFSHSAASKQQELQKLLGVNKKHINSIENINSIEMIAAQRQADATSTLERIGILKERHEALSDEQVALLQAHFQRVEVDPLYGVNMQEEMGVTAVIDKLNQAVKEASAKGQVPAAELAHHHHLSGISGATHVASGSEIGQKPGEGWKR
jgi:hypothetical protein